MYVRRYKMYSMQDFQACLHIQSSSQGRPAHVVSASPWYSNAASLTPSQGTHTNEPTNEDTTQWNNNSMSAYLSSPSLSL